MCSAEKNNLRLARRGGMNCKSKQASRGRSITYEPVTGQLKQKTFFRCLAKFIPEFIPVFFLS